ncbi:TlpA family protein disulfide reductase [Alteromonas sp. 5E99-2]|uniref:TlpA family protein disulfide reductase n=1 Tax=Alteromonas sp. 5E99-2 TaxID=2817683 RepID=UPI001A9915CB|nr:TlpA disulfide reductase family protein [Alteromonas sp. 5E99-2]MBO1256212.1 TlpA family protein disulfide reductase [Alteromonas sp. 5E99-2]
MTNNTQPASTPWYKCALTSWVRDIAVVLVIFFGISAWQTKDMLKADGTVQVDTIVLPGLDDEQHKLFEPAEFDKPTLLYFFAPWCVVCKTSIGNLNELDKDKINIVRVAVDYSSSQAVIDFVEETRAEGPVLLGSNNLKHHFKVPGYPSYYLIDEEQKIIGRSMGYSTEWGLKLKSYLANKS